MGILSWWRTANAVADFEPLTVGSTALATPFAGDSHLNPAFTLDELYEGKIQSVTRSEAMSVPTWAAARSLVCETLARLPLKAYDSTGALLVEQPRFLQWSRYLPARLRMLWTLDDVAHYGTSLWALERGAADSSGRAAILDAVHVDWHRWHSERVEGVEVMRMLAADGTARYLEPDEYILFWGSSDGLLVSAADTIRGAKNLESQWQSRVRNPLPLVEIRYTGDEDLTEDEQRDIRKKYLEARQDPDGVVMVTPRGFQVEAKGADDVNMFVQGRNAVSLDIARFWHVKASLMDASNVNGSSVNYENSGLGRSAFYDIGLRTWALPIEECLSRDNVLPRGTYVAFDLSSLTTADTGTGPVRED